MKDLILNDIERKQAKDRADAALVLGSDQKLSGKLRRFLFRVMGRPFLAVFPTPPKQEIAKLQSQLAGKTAAQLFKMRRRGEIEVQVERRRRQKLLPKITAGVIPDSIGALQFLEGRQRSVEREMVRRGIVYEGD